MPDSHATSWSDEILFVKESDLTAGLNSVAKTLLRLDGWLSGVPGLDAAGAADLRLVCDELGSNIARHCAQGHPTIFRIEARDTGQGSVLLRIINNGDEFNPFTQDTPYLGDDLDRRRVGGLGLYLIRRLFPLGKYRRDGEKNIIEVEYHMGQGGKEKMRRQDAGSEVI